MFVLRISIKIRGKEMIYLIWGDVYTRKSTIALSVPGRKFVFDFEMGVHRAEVQYPGIENEKWNIKPDLNSLTHFKGDRVLGKKENWHELTAKYIEVIQRDDIDVIIFDTAKVLWATCHGSVLQEKQDAQVDAVLAKAPNAVLGVVEANIDWRKQLTEIEYTLPNERMENLINLANNFNKDLVLINHQRPMYGPQLMNGKIESAPIAGKFELDGWRHTSKLSDWIFNTSKENIAIENDPGNTSIKFSAMVEKCPLGATVVGQTMTNLTLPMVLNLAKAMTAVLPIPELLPPTADIDN